MKEIWWRWDMWGNIWGGDTCEGVICEGGVREVRLDINLLCCLHKCPIKNITDITDITQLLLPRPLRDSPTHYRLVLPGLTGGSLITDLVTLSSITMAWYYLFLSSSRQNWVIRELLIESSSSFKSEAFFQEFWKLQGIIFNCTKLTFANFNNSSSQKQFGKYYKTKINILVTINE